MRGLDNNGTVNFRFTEKTGGEPTFQIGDSVTSVVTNSGGTIFSVNSGVGNNPTSGGVQTQTTNATSYSSFSAQGDRGVNYRTAFGVGSSGTTANVYADRGFLMTADNLNGLTLLTGGAGDDIRFFELPKTLTDCRQREPYSIREVVAARPAMFLDNLKYFHIDVVKHGVLIV